MHITTTKQEVKGKGTAAQEVVDMMEGVSMTEMVEVVEVEVYGKRNETPPTAKKYLVRIDKEKYLIVKQFVTGKDLLEVAGKVPISRWRLHQKIHGGQMVEIGYDQDIDLGAQGVERFTTYELTVGDGGEPAAQQGKGVHKEVEVTELVEISEVVEVEEYGKRNETPPKAKQYQVRIDKVKYLIAKQIVSGRVLLAMAGKVPVSGWRLHQKLYGGQMVEIGYDQAVDLGAQGVERFTTYELMVGDGGEPAPYRRSFVLPEEDQDYLVSLGLPWETIKDGATAWLLLHNHPLSAGYNAEKATVAVCITGGYPPAQLDMVYFQPALSRVDGKPIHALAEQNIDGRTFQRWSRHYGWRPGVDSLITHHLRIKEWLETELTRG